LRENMQHMLTPTGYINIKKAMSSARNSGKPVVVEISYTLPGAKQITLARTHVHAVQGGRYLLFFWRKRPKRVYKEYDMHTVSRDLIVIASTRNEPAEGYGLIIGKHVKDLLPEGQYDRFEKVFKMCMDSGKHQLVKVRTDIGEKFLCYLVRRGEVISVHQAYIRDPAKTSELIKLLRRGADNEERMSDKTG